MASTVGVAEEPTTPEDSADLSSQQSAPESPTEPAAEADAAADVPATAKIEDPWERLLNQFPKLKHFLFVHEEHLPQMLRDKLANFAGNRKYIIIIYKVNAFEEIGLINPRGKLAVLKFQEDHPTILAKPGDKVWINVTLEQDSSGAQAEQRWRSTPGGGPLTVRLNVGNGPSFEPGPAIASGVGTHVDNTGAVLETWSWTDDIVLEAF